MLQLDVPSFLWQGFYLGIPVTAPIQPPTQWSGYKTLLSSKWYNLLSKAKANQRISEDWSKIKNLNIWSEMYRTTGICPTLSFHLRFLYKTEDPLSPREYLIFVTSQALSGPWEHFSKMQLLTFIYADWDLTLSQVLWHKISHNYPSAQAMYSKNMTSYTDISISNFLHAGHALKQRSDAHTHTHTHTHTREPLPPLCWRHGKQPLRCHQSPAIYAWGRMQRGESRIFFPPMYTYTHMHTQTHSDATCRSQTAACGRWWNHHEVNYNVVIETRNRKWNLKWKERAHSHA